MATLSQFISHLSTITLSFFTILLIHLILLVRSVTGSVDDGPITTTKYLKLIDKKCPATPYKTGERFRPSECAVCLSKFEEGEAIRKLKCKHTFHKDCLDTWLQLDKATCPLCRQDVLPEDIMVRYRMRRELYNDYDGTDEELIFLLSAVRGNYLRRLL